MKYCDMLINTNSFGNNQYVLTPSPSAKRDIASICFIIFGSNITDLYLQ